MSFPALNRLMREGPAIKQYSCEICGKTVLVDQVVHLYLDRGNPKENVYAHEKCLQVNCLACGKAIHDLKEQLQRRSAVAHYPAEKGFTMFRHFGCSDQQRSYFSIDFVGSTQDRRPHW